MKYYLTVNNQQTTYLINNPGMYTQQIAITRSLNLQTKPYSKLITTGDYKLFTKELFKLRLRLQEVKKNNLIQEESEKQSLKEQINYIYSEIRNYNKRKKWTLNNF